MVAATELKSQNNLLQQKLNEATKQLERCAIVNDKLKQACRVHLQDMSARWSNQYTQKSIDIAQMFDAKYGPLQSRQTALRERQQVMQVKFNAGQEEMESKERALQHKLGEAVQKLEACTAALHAKEQEVSQQRESMSHKLQHLSSSIARLNHPQPCNLHPEP